jgi:hypothetical protein
LNAVSLGDCTFGFSTGLISTGDEQLIRGVGAHEVAHEVLGHANKRKAAIATQQAISTVVSFIPGIGGLIATSAVLVASMFALPAYSRSQEGEADEQAVAILRLAGDPDPAGTMAHTFRVLLTHEGASGGGLLDSHPGTTDRLEAMQKRQELAEGRSAPPMIAKESAPGAAGPPSTLGEESPPSQPALTDPGKGPVEKIDSGSSQSPPEGPPREMASRTTPSVVTALEWLQDPMSVHALSQGPQAVVVFVYREGSPTSDRVAECLGHVAGRFADQARFFRTEISVTAAELVGPDPSATPILIIFRKGKEHARVVGLPSNRPPATPAEEAVADWLAEHLKEDTD